MNCDSVRKLIPLYFYGEVTPDEEDQVDQHLHECAACAAELEQQSALAGALDQRKLEIPPVLLEECRDDLMAAIAGGAPRQVKPVKGPWPLFLEAMSATFAGFSRLRQPVAALLLILLGFGLARFTGAVPTPPAIFSDNVYPAVRDVRAENDGTVRIRFDETSHHEVTGRLEDANIKRLLLAGSRDEDAAVRVESVGLLKNRVDSPEVRDSLLNALAGDPNDGVRLKALDALRPLAGDARVTKTLSQVLLNDANPAVRMQVIDLMVTRRDDSMVGVLQNLMQREDNSGVRLKASKVLKDWNASIGTF
jgi:anti-sigma factor RsiW